MEKGTKTFLGWATIVLGVLVFLVPLAVFNVNGTTYSYSTWANYILGILVFLQGIWLLSTK